MFTLIKYGTNIDFVSKRHIWMGISVLAILGTFVLFFTKGLNLGIDFTGGAEFNVKIPKAWDITKVRDELTKGGLDNLKVVQVGEPELNEYLVRARGDDKTLSSVSTQLKGVLAKTFKEGSAENEFLVLKEDIVGAVAGGLLARKGFFALFYALMVIMLYVAIRFDPKYAPGAVIALFHDSMIVLGIFILTQKQFDMTILAALLALAGYSNNDTIIVFDRVRETTQMYPNMAIEDAVNRSVNETLSRTINTSLTTFLTVFALWLLGGQVIENFAFAYMAGLIVGTYSSVFIASSLVIYVTKYQQKRSQRGGVHARGTVGASTS